MAPAGGSPLATGGTTGGIDDRPKAAFRDTWRPGAASARRGDRTRELAVRLLHQLRCPAARRSGSVPLSGSEGPPSNSAHETIPAMATRRSEDPAILHRKAQARILSRLAAGEDDVFAL